MPEHKTWLDFIPGLSDLFERLSESFGVTWFNRTHVTMSHVATAIFVLLVLFVVVLIYKRYLKSFKEGVIPPSGFSLAGFVDLVLEATLSLMKDLIGPEGPKHFPVVATLALFILFSNLLGLVPGFAPPTSNLNTTLACAIFVFLYYNWIGIRKQGLIRYLTHIANPIGSKIGWFIAPLMLPIELISHLARPMSLSIRLMGNMMGDHTILGIFLLLVPMFIPIPLMLLGLIVAFVQTFVFCLLTVVYIALAVEEAEGH